MFYCFIFFYGGYRYGKSAGGHHGAPWCSWFIRLYSSRNFITKYLHLEVSFSFILSLSVYIFTNGFSYLFCMWPYLKHILQHTKIKWHFALREVVWTLWYVKIVNKTELIRTDIWHHSKLWRYNFLLFILIKFVPNCNQFHL